MPGEDEQEQQSVQVQKSTTAPWEAAQPLLTNLIGKYAGMNTDVTAGQNTALNNLTSSAAGIPNFGADAAGALSKVFGSNTAPQVGMLNQGYADLQKNIGGTASGAELDPYATPGFGAALSKMSDDITSKVKGVYAGAGRDPSGAGSFAGTLASGLSEGLMPGLLNQFNQNKSNQMNAANTLYGASGTTAGNITGQQGQQNAALLSAVGATPQVSQAFTNPGMAQYAAETTKQQAPWANLMQQLQASMGLGAMGSQSSGSSTTNATTTQPQSTMGNIFGGLASGAGLLSTTGAFGPAGWLLASDERVKDEIAPVGELDDGQTVYRYRYKDSPVMQIGLLAQDVAERDPEAVGDMGTGAGILGVNYRRATDRAAAMRKAA